MFKRANLGNTSNSTSDELSFFSRNRENYVGTVEPKEEKKPEFKKKNTRSCEDVVGSPPKRTKRRGTGDDDEDSGDEIISTQKRHANVRERFDFCGWRLAATFAINILWSNVGVSQIQRLGYHALRLGVFTTADE